MASGAADRRPAKLGILAGGGPLPRRLAEARLAAGGEVFLIAFEGQTDPEAVDGIDHVWHRLGATGGSIKALKKSGCVEVVMAGPMKRPALSELSLDARSALAIALAGPRIFGDDGLLSLIVEEMEKDGLVVIGIEDVIGSVLVEAGVVVGPARLDSDVSADVARGIAALKAIGATDIGQAVAVQEGMVLAVEAVEGTDRMIARAGGLKRGTRGPVLVKGTKPGQEGRADRPTIGPKTIAACVEAGFVGIAVEAGGTLLVDREETVRRADAAGLFIHAVPFEEA